MADDISVDFSEVERLVVNIGRASAAAVTASRGVVKKGLDNIKKDTIQNLSDNPRWKGLKRAVNYEIVGLEGEVGYEDTKQGELAGIYEFGTPRTAPHPTLHPAAEREAPRFEKAMAEAVTKAAEDTL